jgi:hypothetical protein
MGRHYSKFCKSPPSLLESSPCQLYQYRCEKCGKKFERTEPISEHEAMKSTH